MSPKVSVNIACYNHENFVGEAIQSVLNQTFQDFEIIILNNGSTDNSLKIIESFNDPRIKVESVYPNQQSTYAGINLVERGCGEYVALLCSDDAWEPDKLEKQVKYLDEHPECGVVFTRVQPFNEHGEYDMSKKNFYHKHFNILENRSRFEWLRNMFITSDHSFCCSSACVRRQCFEDYGNFDIRTKHIQDFILWTGILLHKEAYILDEKLTKMRFFSKESNLGALSDNTIICSLNEMSMLFAKFEEIDNLDDFIKIFPETLTHFRTVDKKYMHFYLSILCLNISRVINYKAYAIQLLYRIFKEKQMQEDLKKDLDFTHMNLYELATNFDCYNYYTNTRVNIFNVLVDPIVNLWSKYVLGIWNDKKNGYLVLRICNLLRTKIYYRKKEIHKQFY